jgi:hypothetical protein
MNLPNSFLGKGRTISHIRDGGVAPSSQTVGSLLRTPSWPNWPKMDSAKSKFDEPCVNQYVHCNVTHKDIVVIIFKAFTSTDLRCLVQNESLVKKQPVFETFRIATS